MKDKVTMLVIGFLIGAIVAIAGFFIYSKLNTATRGEMPGMGQNGQMGEPPEGFDGEEPPEMPNSNGSTNNRNQTSNETSSNT